MKNIVLNHTGYKMVNLKSPFINNFSKFIKNCESELIISTPFINKEGTKNLIKNIKNNDITLSLITNLSSKNIINDVTQASAILELYDHFKINKIVSISKLHAKLYISDKKSAIVTSANLTNGGLITNFEYGILINEKNFVNQIIIDLNEYNQIGNEFSFDVLGKIDLEYKKLKNEIDKNKNKIGTNPIDEIINSNKTLIVDELFSNQIKDGKTINEIFCNTILYLLSNIGELTTKELNSHIKEIHPDICDDNIDRVINGQSFGKKWKHSVRNAQVTLRKKGIIRIVNNDKNSKWIKV